MADNSDYSKPRLNLIKFLEGTTFDTPVNRSLIENTYNRFLTKDETVESIGTVGIPDTAAAVDRQLKEDTVHRQTYQLQPMMHRKVATIDYTMAFKDIVSELERLGVDSSRLDKWADTEQFNYAPPVDLDKLVNYRDYYWYDEDQKSLVPQYIVIKNPCTVSSNRLIQRQKDVAGVGEMRIVGVDALRNEFIVQNNVLTLLPVGTMFDVAGAEPVNGLYTVDTIRFVDGVTRIKPTIAIPSNLYNGAKITFDSQIALLTAEKNQVCDSTSGWDVGQWDDASPASTGLISVTEPVQLQFLKENAVETFNLIIKHHSNYVDAQGNVVVFDARPLYQWLDSDKPEFQISWDGYGSRSARNAWQMDNKWVHKLDLAQGAISKSIRAEAPIIEYLPNLQMNEWSHVRHKWMHRANPNLDTFAATDAQPTLAEYLAPGFVDKWVYIGATETVPTTIQPANATATLMSTDVAAASVMDCYRSFTITAVDPDTNRISFTGAPTLLNGTAVIVSDNVTKNSLTTTSIASVASGVTSVTLSSIVGVAVGETILVPTTSVFDVVLFPAAKAQTALAGTNAPRVYVDEVQSLGQFDEITVLGPGAKYYVIGIKLEAAVSMEQRVDVGVDPAAAFDIGKNVWNVRLTTQLDDKKYLEDGKPTTIISAVSFYKMQQSKAVGEQKVPLFDLFNPDGTTANKANQIFFWQLDQTAKVNQYVGLRLKTEVRTGNVFFFDQMLIDYDNGPMLCYKDLSSIDGNNPSGLQTIWRTDLNNRYVPRFVDDHRRVDGEVYFDAKNVQQIAHVDATNGDWEIINQHAFNASHENRKIIDSVDLTEHIKSIMVKQPTLEGFLPSKYGFRLSETLNYGLGGTIKEHNGSYDALASALFVDGSTPTAVISYAGTAYETALSSMKDYVMTNAVAFLTNKKAEYIADLSTQVTVDAIEAFETNDNNSVVFGDSNTYIDGKGVKNWPATIPFLGLGPLCKPHMVTDAALGINEILHHDGHYDSYSVTPADQIGLARQVARTRYTTTSDVGVKQTRYFGWTTAQAADGQSLVTSYTAIDWRRLAAGDVWVDGQVFKRFQVVDISVEAPSADIVDGALWLRSTDGQLMVKKTIAGLNQWRVLAGSVPGNVSAAWTDVNVSQILNTIVLEVENRLYAAGVEQAVKAVLPKDLYIRSDADVTLHRELEQNNFEQFTRDRQINTPYASVYKQANPFTWNYSGVDANEVVSGTYVNVWQPNAVSAPIEWAGYWAGVYKNVYGTSYPHREPWILQGFTSKPTWWDTLYLDPTGTRVWKAIMWSNVLANCVPIQFETPSPVISTTTIAGSPYNVLKKRFTYVPVNIARPITSTGGTVIYKLDDLFPLYDSRVFLAENSDIIAGSSVGKPMIRRAQAITGVNFRLPFIFGDGSPIEWEWTKSTDAKYGELKNAFLMQPIRFIDATWGTKFDIAGSLKVNAETHKVFSHWDTIFHGDVVDGKIYQSIGINQWYVNYNRSSGLDFKVSNFREMWTEWDMNLAYQFGCYINTRSLDVSSSSYDMIREDFTLISKKSPGFEVRQVDSLHVTVANYGDYRTTGNLKVPLGDGYSWSFLVDVPSTVTEIQYYGVAKYEYQVVDMATGLLEITEGILPWKDGDQVYLYSTQYAPYPMDPAWAYYVSTVTGSTKQFRVSRSKSDAMNKTGTFLRTEGTGVQYIGQVNSTFMATGGKSTSNAWTHNAIDKKQIITATVPHIVQGVQGLIDFIDGYAARLEDIGIKANDSSAREIDPNTGLLVSWQTELERAITKIYTGIGKSNTSIKQYGNTYKYTVRSVDDLVDVFVMDSVTALPFQLAEEVYVFTEGTVPAGLTLNVPYYVIPVDATSFSLASTPENAYDNIGMNITGEGIGEQYVGTFPSTFVSGDEYAEINPFRNNVWVNTPTGLVANVFTGGSQDTSNEVTVYDQYGRPLPKGSLTVLREDLLTRVTVRPYIPNDVLVTSAQDTYNNIHIGGVKFYIDGYEHVVMFNNYTTEGYLIYDPYVGMDVSRLSVSFSRSTNKTMRPALGGYYYHNGEMVRNLEASVSDMRSYYDTYGGTNVSDFTEFSRALLGYADPTYLDQLNTPDRSKFLFWKGMIQRKGSKNTVNAFINSKHFVDAHVDEFWSYKVADFGDARQKYKPEINIRVSDSYTSDFRYEFSAINGAVSSRFVGVDYSDESRWVNPMEVQAEMGGNPLYFDAEEVIATMNVVTHSSGKYVTLNARLDDVRMEYTQSGVTTTLTVGSGLTKINERVYKLPTLTPVAQVKVVGHAPATAKLDPILTIDKQSNATVASSKVWDPLNGYHYYAPLKDVTYWSGEDPADYDSGASWTTEQVGRKWVDASTFAYVPYDDNIVFPEFNDQMARWGRLTQWADPAVYEWVRSTRPPQEFLEAIDSEEGDISIPIAQRASGTPYAIVRRASDNLEITLTPVEAVYDVADKLAAMKANPMYAGLDVLVYINGVFAVQRNLAAATVADFVYTLGEYVVLKPSLPVGEEGFITDYRYSTVVEADANGDDVTVYYFWTRDRNVAPKNELSASQIASQLAYPNAPYHLYRKYVAASGTMPNRYVQVVMRNTAQLVNDNDRYVAQFTRDFTLRDKLSAGKTAMDLKNKHSEWVMFREKQPYKISGDLWDNMAEALIGYEIAGFDIGTRTPVPSMTYTLYDQKNSTSTRFGMNKGQAFVDRAQGLATIQSVLEDPTFNTAPIDKYVFLETHTFDTPVNIRRSLQYIFTNFSDASVNRMFFEVMRDALANKLDFTGVFMTSFVALHGIKILETSGSVV